jgi:hypothetical protein
MYSPVSPFSFLEPRHLFLPFFETADIQASFIVYTLSPSQFKNPY